MNRVYILSILAAVLVCAPLKGQITGGVIIDTTATLPALNDDMEDNLSLRNTLDNMFSELEKDRVPTGLLRDFAVELVDISKFDGTLADSTLLNARTFEYILRSIRSSAVGQKPFSTVSSIMADMKSHQTRAVIPFGVAAFRYNYIVSNAVSSGLIEYNQATGKVYDQYSLQIIDPGLVQPGDMFEPKEPYQPGPENPDPHIIDPIIEPNPDPVIPGEIDTWINPYAEAYVYAASPSVDIITSPYVTFSFSDDWIFSNLNIVSLEFDSGLGQGYQTISLSGEDFSVYYGGQGGVFETKTRLTLANGTVLQSHNTICVYSIDALVAPMSEPDTTKPFVSNVTLEGHTPHAMVSIKYAPSNGTGHIVKPLIVAEGFDPLSINPEQSNTSYYHNKGYRSLSDLIGTPLAAEYDIVYIDWEDSFAPIEANADIFIQVIQWVNSTKVGSEKNVVLGYSMGGLVARYALCKMEEDNLPHETIAYVSYDTPHLGAHIPLGYMYLARDIYNGVYFQQLPSLAIMGGLAYIFFARIFQSGFATTMDEILALPNAPSVREMLYYYVNNNSVMDNTRHYSWQSTLNSIGFPKGQNNLPMVLLAVSNGGASVEPVPSENMSLAATLFINYGENMIIQFLNALFLDLLGQPDIFNHIDLLASVLFPRQTTYTLDTKVLPFITDNQEVYYSRMTIYKHFLWWFDSYEVTYETHKNGQSDGAPLYETLPSSYYVVNNNPNYIRDTINIPILASHAGAIFGMNSKIPFVPVASSLCSDSYNVDFTNKTIQTLSHTPFNSYYIGTSPSQHIQYIDGVYNWISDASKFNMYGDSDNTVVTGDTLRITSPRFSGGTWYSSNPAVASVDSYGRINVSRRGSITIGYKGYDPFGYPYNFKRTFFAGGQPQFILSYHRMSVPLMDGSYLYTITASYVGDSGVGLTPTHIYWTEIEPPRVGIGETPPAPTYNWTESSSFSYSTSLAWNSDTMVCFRAEYEGFSTQTYHLYCKNPDYNIPGIIDDGGLIQPMDPDSGGGEGLQVKSSGETESLTYVINGESFVFDGRPDNYTILSNFLENAIFVNQVKEMAPWGDKDFVIIPFRVVNNDTSEVFDACVKLLYQTNNNEE